MINYKIERGLTGSENWPQVPSVFVKGIKEEPELDPKKSEEENEKTIQTWKNVAVLKVSSKAPATFYIGFSNLGVISYLKHEFTTDLEFGMRVGDDDVRFFALPKNLEDKISLDLVTQTTENDTKYKDLILI